MSPKSTHFSTLLLFSMLLLKFSESANLKLEEIKLCDPNRNYPIKFWYELKTSKNHNFQVVSGNLSLPVQLGSNIKSKCKIDILRGEEYKTLLTVSENDICKAMNKYLGEFWFKIQRKINTETPIGSCPVPKGTYYLHNFPMDFDLLTVRTFPTGKIRVTERMVDSETSDVMLCFIVTLNSE